MLHSQRVGPREPVPLSISHFQSLVITVSPLWLHVNKQADANVVYTPTQITQHSLLLIIALSLYFTFPAPVFFQRPRRFHKLTSLRQGQALLINKYA